MKKKNWKRPVGDTYVGDSRHQLLVTIKKSQTESLYELPYIKQTQAWDMLVLILKTFNKYFQNTKNVHDKNK